MARTRRRRPWSLIIIVAVALIGLTYTIVSVDRPLLGLDLQGGVSVVLKPKDPHVSQDTLDQAIAIINQRVNALGVAEPDITRQGNDVLVQIPGVKDKDRALKLVGETAELQFRPVLASYQVSTAAPPSTKKNSSTSTTTKSGSTTTSTGATTTTTAATSTTQRSLGITGTGEQAAGTVAPSSLSDLAADPTTTAAPSTTTAAPSTTTAAAPSQTQVPALTPEDQIKRNQPVVLPAKDLKTGDVTAIYSLGPTVLTGSSLSSASADLNQQSQWEIRPVFKAGKTGIDLFNQAASACYSGSSTCPPTASCQGSSGGGTHGALAVVLDNNVLTAPAICNASFQRDQITISGSYKESAAKDVATALKYGALPVVLIPQQSEIVSATLGRDALHAGLVAGAVAFVLVGLYMIFFYRILGVLAVLKLGIEGCILWAILCYSGAQVGLALTLAGITGIIVSIGVSLDSNVVYYEHLKEDVRAGRTVRASVDKSFTSAWSTIVAADLASVIGAGILYVFTVGAVRGFAFYLGLATLLDLLTSWCYMRPAVGMATRSKMCTEHPHRFGLPEREEVEAQAAATRELVGMATGKSS